MEIQMITDYIDAPYNMKEDDFEKIQELLDKYPFFHTANMLYIKAAHNINYEGYNSLIGKVSASVPNREILHSLINLEEVEVVEVVEEKEEKVETGARKEIRERLMKRRKQRQLEKGEILSDDGKSWHNLIIGEFFKPSIEELVKEFNRSVGKSTDKVVVEEISSGTKAEKVKEEIKIKKEPGIKKEPEVKKEPEAVKEKKPAQEIINEVRSEEEFTNIVILPGEKTKDDPVKVAEDAKADAKDKEKAKEEIKDGIKPEIKPEVKEELKKEEEKTESGVQMRKKTQQVIVEDIVSENLTTGKDEGEVIENIYDRIITSKKPKVPSEKKTDFIEINDDITGLEDKSIPDEKTAEIKTDEPVEIISEDKPEIKEELISEEPEIKHELKTKPKIKDIKAEEDIVLKDKPEDIISVTEDKQDIVKEEALNIHEDIKDEIEFISDDEDTVMNEPVKSDLAKDDDPIMIEDDTDDEIEITEEFELIDKPADEKTKEEDTKVELKETDKHKKIESTEEKSVESKTIEKKSEKTKKEEPKKEELKKDPTEVPKKNLTEKIKTEVKKELTDEEAKAKAKAADDIFARIEAYKKKKVGSDTKEEEEDKEKGDLINKFVEGEPSIKRPEKDAENKEEIIEESVEQKPVVTELMASIFINQGKYDQAIEIYQQLILKNPEKKDYFAAKIEETEKLK